MTFKTVEQMQDEIEQLRVDYNEAFIDGANTERAKIVAWLRDDADEFVYANLKKSDSDANIISETIVRCMIGIGKREYLK
jgi:hypothetical protein